MGNLGKHGKEDENGRAVSGFGLRAWTGSGGRRPCTTPKICIATPVIPVSSPV